jgi:hypothetical protein
MPPTPDKPVAPTVTSTTNQHFGERPGTAGVSLDGLDVGQSLNDDLGGLTLSTES